MLIIKMLVLVRQAKLLVNVFWIVRKIVVAKLNVSQLSKMSILNALVRFVDLITTN